MDLHSGAGMKHTIDRTIKSENGQTMTEFAIVLPIFVALLFGIIQFGIAFNNYVTLTDAARAGAREGAVSRNSSDPAGDCRAAVRSALSASPYAPDCSQARPKTNRAAGNPGCKLTASSASDRASLKSRAI